MEEMMRELIAVNKQILAAFERLSIGGDSGGEERLPSLTIEDMATGEKVKITTKAYESRPLVQGTIDAHLDAHAYAHQCAAELAMTGWKSTVSAIQAKVAMHKRIYGEEPGNTAYDLKP